MKRTKLTAILCTMTMLAAFPTAIRAEDYSNYEKVIYTPNRFGTQEIGDYKGGYTTIPTGAEYWYDADNTDEEYLYNEFSGFVKNVFFDGARDGTVTAWNGGSTKGVVAYIDLKDVRKIDGLDLWTKQDGNSKIESYTIETSTDGVNYTLAGTYKNADTASSIGYYKMHLGINPTDARYIKLSVNKLSGTNSMNIREVVVTGLEKSANLRLKIEQAKNLNLVNYTKADADMIKEYIAAGETAMATGTNEDISRAAEDLGYVLDFPQTYSECILSDNDFSSECAEDIASYGSYEKVHTGVEYVWTSADSQTQNEDTLQENGEIVKRNFKLINGFLTRQKGDRMISTYWTNTEEETPVTATFDLKAVYNVSQVDFWTLRTKTKENGYIWGTKNCKEFSVEVSTDGEHFTSVGTVRNPANFFMPANYSTVSEILKNSAKFDACPARYVRVTFKKQKGFDAMGLGEVVIIGNSKTERLSQLVRDVSSIDKSLLDADKLSLLTTRVQQAIALNQSENVTERQLDSAYEALAEACKTAVIQNNSVILSGNQKSDTDDDYYFKTFCGTSVVADTGADYSYDSSMTDGTVINNDSAKVLLNGNIDFTSRQDVSSGENGHFGMYEGTQAAAVFDLKKVRTVNKVVICSRHGGANQYGSFNFALGSAQVMVSADGINYKSVVRCENPDNNNLRDYWGTNSFRLQNVKIDFVPENARYVKVILKKPEYAKAVSVNEIFVVGYDTAELTVANSEYLTADGNQLKSISEGTVTAVTDIANNNAEDKALSVVNAVYDGQGQLVGTYMSADTVAANSGKRFESSVAVSADADNTYQLKTFVWDMTQMKPLLSKRSLTNPFDFTGSIE